VLCPECGASGESDPELSRWQCVTCGSGFFLRRCSACARVSYVSGLQGFRSPWPCTWCGQFNAGFSQNQDPAAASAAELAAEVARYSPAGSVDNPAGSVAAPGACFQANSPPGADHDPGPSARDPARRSGRRRMRRIALPVAVVVACVAATAVQLTAGSTGAAGMAAGPVGKGGATRAIRVTASRVGTIDFQGVPGQLAVVGTGTGQVILTGQVHGTASAPVVETRLDRAAGVLAVSVRCAPASLCTQNLRLAVPADTGVAVRQPGGRVVLTGLAGPLRITAENADISASGLRSPDLAAAITSGHLNATFTAPPRQVSITLASAQATLYLPDRAAYRIAQEVASGYVRIAIPQAGGATRTVTARIDSGELELLPS